MTSLADFFATENPVDDPLWTDLRDMIKRKYAKTPRNLQRELGPSSTGHPCLRRLAFGMMEIPRSNPEWDPLPSITGTAMHTWLEEAARQDNERLGRERWLIETKVEVTPGLSGSCDLFDTDRGTVIDWKNLGPTSFMAKVKNPGATYRNQVHQYGRGFKNLGYQVNEVAIAILPRAGTLRKMHLWKEPYSDEVVDAVLRRRESVMMMLDDFDVENHPDRYRWIAITEDQCVFCPWFKPEPINPLQCSGKS